MVSTSSYQKNFIFSSRITSGKEQDEIESFLSEGGILDALNSSRLLLVTTDQEVPETIHKEYMIRGITVVRDFLNKDLN